jgi:hypothetical protein
VEHGQLSFSQTQVKCPASFYPQCFLPGQLIGPGVTLACRSHVFFTDTKKSGVFNGIPAQECDEATLFDSTINPLKEDA